MNLSAWFIRRPVATFLLMIGLLFIGIASYTQLPIAGVPQVDIPTISVNTDLPGASAETVASSITSPLERALAILPGVTSLTSTSSLGASSISVQFDLARSVDAAALDVQSAINAALGDLPKNLPHPPTFEKKNPSDALLMTIAVYADNMPIGQVDDYVENFLTPEIARVRGVGAIDYHGRQKPAVRIQMDPNRVAAMGLTLEDVRQRIAEATANGPKGTLNGSRQSITLDTNDQLSQSAEYGAIALTSRNGATVKLRDAGVIVNSVEDVKQSAWLGQHQAVMIDVHKQIGFNVNATVAKVKEALPALERNLPPSLHLVLLGDRTQTIRSSVSDVQFTLFLTCLLVVFVVYIFLGSIRATLIPAIVIPLSLFGTMAAMYGLGYTLDNVSLMALTISIGFVVDDAIVMLENILRHVEEGMEPQAAAFKGSHEIGFTIFSMTISLVAVFIPLLFMGGVVGRLFREFADTAAIAILISGVVSLTLTPVLCARFLSVQSTHRSDWFHQRCEHFLERMRQAYAGGLRTVLRHQRLTLGVMLATLVVTLGIYVYIPKGFFPQQDNGLIAGVTEASPDISYPAMLRQMQALANTVRQDPDIQNVYFWIEGDPSLNVGRLLIDLKPFELRRASVYEVIDRIGKRVRNIPEITLHMQARQDLQIGARVSKTQFQYTLRDANLAELQLWTPRMLAALRTIPQIRDVEGDSEPTAPRLQIVLDREAMARLGVNTQAVDDTLYDAFGQRQVASFYTQVSVYRVVLEVDPRFQLDESALARIYVPSKSGVPVLLSAISRFEHSSAPLTVNHDGQFPASTLSFNLAPGQALGDAIDAINAKERSMAKPAGLSSIFAGSAQAFQESLANQPFLILAALLAIFIVLGILYESFIHPITIMSTLPSAGIGGLLALILLHYDFSLVALIGVMLLIGIVKKNGIMMVDVAIVEEAGGLSPEEAIYKACLLRFRPIMMTTMVALLGALPLALGAGAGSELRRPLGIAMVGGLLLSQVLTLYTTPVVYLYMDRMVQRLRRKRAETPLSL
ncbi:efflux RND transporter permease subunit [Collimonas fungivorans]|uniref:RND efflux transporter n=1 Tax=Collimonas fungivorans (strain Ter331) TaxID=1005048 RepID=G0AHE2_COLFT|nr:efflux RND transporter permease subunit [Collimonas fungivorans]AEK62548.1 RND efflux transporter [Collimonas fungivorans Ter331]